MTTAVSVARGAMWSYLAQIGSVAAQFVYAAITARLLAPDLFGVLAAAMTSTTIVNVLALAGLSQVVGRMTVLEPSRLLGLLLYSAVVGGAVSLLSLASSGLWAALWNVPEAAALIQLLAITSFVTPLLALGSALLVRLGQFRRLATLTLGANLTGMVGGAIMVYLVRSPTSLVASPIVAQCLIALSTLLVARRQFGGKVKLRATLTDVGFSAKTTTSGILSYTAGLVGKVAVSQGFGSALLGNWNRAEALTTTPFNQLSYALGQAVYPEFRHDIDSRERTRRIWSDLLAMVGWIGIPLGAVVAVLAPTAVSIILGNGWGQAAAIAPILAVMGGLQPVVYVLVSGLEALGRFRWIWAGWILSIAVNLVGAAVAVSLKSVQPVFVGALAAQLLMHALHLGFCARSALINLSAVLRNYLQIAAFAGGLAAITAVAVNGVTLWRTAPWVLLIAAIALAGAMLGLWRSRTTLTPLALARAYRLLPARSRRAKTG